MAKSLSDLNKVKKDTFDDLCLYSKICANVQTVQTYRIETWKNIRELFKPCEFKDEGFFLQSEATNKKTFFRGKKKRGGGEGGLFSRDSYLSLAAAEGEKAVGSGQPRGVDNKRE